MDSLTAHCDKRQHCWVMWSYQLFVFNVQDRSTPSNNRTPLSLFSPLKINSDLQFHRYRMGYWARFWNKIQIFSQILLQMNHARFFIPSPCSSPAFLFECYGRVKLMNAFLKRKTLQGLAQANGNYSKSFVKLNCNNIANTISFCVMAINRVYPTRAGLVFMLFGFVSGSKHNLINHCRCIKQTTVVCETIAKTKIGFPICFCN